MVIWYNDTNISIEIYQIIQDNLRKNNEIHSHVTRQNNNIHLGEIRPEAKKSNSLTVYRASLMVGLALLYSSMPCAINVRTLFTLYSGLYRSVTFSSSEELLLTLVKAFPAVTRPLSCSTRLLNTGFSCQFISWI